MSSFKILFLSALAAIVAAQSFEVENSDDGVLMRLDGSTGLEAWNGTSLESVFDRIQQLENSFEMRLADLQSQIDECACNKQLAAVQEIVLRWNIYDNDMPSTVPETMEDACAIEYFDCDVNNDLTRIDLSTGNEFGSLPTTIGYLSHLTKVYLKNIRCQAFTDNLFPSQISQLGLREIIIRSPFSTQCNLGIDLTGMDSITFISMSSYQPFDVYGSPLPQWIAELPYLQSLNLVGMGISGTLPAQLFASTSLSYLGLSTNKIMSPLPTQVARLATLNLQANSLAGTLPSEIFSSSTLATLSLYYNDISGPLPPFDMPNLNFLQLHENPNLVGSLPQLNTPKLAYAYLQDCGFTGAIPSEYATLTNLVYLSLEDNELEGQIPDLNSLTRLSSCYLSGNMGLLCDNFSLPSTCAANYVCPTSV